MKYSAGTMTRLTFAITFFSFAISAMAQVKTSQHDSFKPEDFERVAILVKPITDGNGGGFSFASRRVKNQSQLERKVEQNFIRVLMAKGYTLVSRTDLDSAMVERGLDQANMTDEKFSEEAGKILHVPALMMVSVDTLSVTQLQAQTPAPNGRGFGTTRNYYQVSASISARLVKISDNMVLWTGDYTVIQAVATQDADSSILGSMAEAVAKKFPALKVEAAATATTPTPPTNLDTNLPTVPDTKSP